MSTKAIRALYEARLKTWADAHAPVLKIAFENVTFAKPATGIYLRAFTLPNPTDSRFMEATDRVYMGVFQVSIVSPINTSNRYLPYLDTSPIFGWRLTIVL